MANKIENHKETSQGSQTLVDPLLPLSLHACQGLLSSSCSCVPGSQSLQQRKIPAYLHNAQPGDAAVIAIFFSFR